MNRPQGTFLFALSLAAVALFAAGTPVLRAQAPVDPVQTAINEAYTSNDPAVLKHAAQVLDAEVMAAKLSASPDNVEVRKALGLLYLDKLKQPADALEHLQKVADALPTDAGWLQTLARATRAAGHRERAAKLYERAGELNPSDPWARYERGQLLLEMQCAREAEAAFREAAGLEKKSPWPRLALAKALAAEGKREEALQIAATVMQEDTQNPDAKWLAEQLADKPEAPKPGPAAHSTIPAYKAAIITAYKTNDPQQFARAAELLEAHLRAHPHDLENRKTLGFLYLDKLHDPKRAIPHLQLVVEALPRDAAWPQLLAKACEKADDFEGAARAYRHAAELDRHDLWSRYHLGRMLANLKRQQEAEAAYREAAAIDPKNVYVQLELARLRFAAGDQNGAAAIAHDILREHPENAEAHVLLGKVERADGNLAGARREFGAALLVTPDDVSAKIALEQITRQNRRRASATFYTFKDTDDFRQTGVYTGLTLLTLDNLRVTGTANELFFKRPPGETIERFEFGLLAEYHLSRAVQLTAGLSDFKTSNLSHEFGGNVGVYVTPIQAVDVSATFSGNAPVNDSYITARDAFTQNIFAGALNYRAPYAITASVAGSVSQYSDHNYRRAFLASVAWAPLPKYGVVVRMEYDWLDYDRHSPQYSSPQDYTRLRPVLEFAPQITDWLRLQFHGEVPYVVTEHDWGTGLTVGPRFTRGDWLDVGLLYMNYRIPGGQTIWSGDGFKADVLCRF